MRLWSLVYFLEVLHLLGLERFPNRGRSNTEGESVSKQTVELLGGLLGAQPGVVDSSTAMLRRSVHCVLRGLPEQQANVLSLAMIEGFSNAEIAEILGSSLAIMERVRAEATMAVLTTLEPTIAEQPS